MSNGDLSDPLWIHEWSILLKKDQLERFWPSNEMSQNERINSFTRFVIYATVVLGVVTSKTTYYMLGATIVMIIGLVSRSMCPSFSKELFANYPQVHNSSDARFSSTEKCLQPTANNPFGNVLAHEQNTRSMPACNYKDTYVDINEIMKGSVPVDAAINQEAIHRQFYQMPNTEAIPDTEKFGQFLFGQGDTCKENYTVCTGFDYGPKSNVPHMNG